jgi:hypothetical protein
VLYDGEVEEKEGLIYKVKFMRRLGETWKFAFPDKNDMSEIEREDIVVKLPRPMSSGGTTCTTTLKYFGVNFSLFQENIL